MFVDANHLRDGTIIAADLCIVGAGAAGVTLTHSLRDAPFSIALLESGGTQSEEATQALYAGTYMGNVPKVDASYLRASRIRMYGGSTNLWGGYCRPLEPLDFETRPWVPDSGWPISRSDLDPYYRAASVELGIEPFESRPSYFDEPAFSAPLAGGGLAERLYQFRYVNIGAKHLPELKAAAKTKVYTHANAVDVVLSSSGSAVDHVSVATLSGRRATVRAKAYVLAAGGIENARLLLASRGVNPRGVGNDDDLVGRFFMEHPCVAGLGPMLARKSTSFARYDIRVIGSPGPDGSASSAPGAAMFVAPTDDVLRERHLLNVAVQLATVQGPGAAFKGFDQSIARACSSMDGETAHGFVPPQRISFGFMCEHAPNRESRVKLGTELDALGMPRPELDWRTGPREVEAVEALAEMLAREAGSRRLGRVCLVPQPASLVREFGFANHHMGTTRMSADPKLGVVNRDCRVHGVDNLFVAGSSVFATSGSANPTYTILALALRLSEHLRDRFT